MLGALEVAIVVVVLVRDRVRDRVRDVARCAARGAFAGGALLAKPLEQFDGDGELDRVAVTSTW